MYNISSSHSFVLKKRANGESSAWV